MPTFRQGLAMRWLLSFVLLLGHALGGCSSSDPGGTDGETHFLKSCSLADDDCADGLSCLCGVCTQSCEDEAACAEFPGARCVARGASSCSDVAAALVCDVECRGDADCRDVSAFHVCSQGACRTEAPPAPGEGSLPSDAGASTSPVASDTEASTADASAPSCALARASANEVLILGDSFFGNTHQVTAYLEAFARDAGALAPGERYRDNARVVANTLSGGAMGIAGQYADAVSDAAVRVVVMNGGGADALVASCDPVDTTCPALVDAAEQATTLLAQMATDAVEQVIYVYYPDTTDAALNEKLDALRPMLESVCAEAPVSCSWIDLRATFSDKEEYLASGGALPSDAGAEATASTIWQVLSLDCR
jgi:hypothetical protein